ncbi:MAG: replication restart helicase PriA [bacterium]
MSAHTTASESGSAPAYLEVVFNVPVEGPFTYRVPEGMSVGEDVNVGRRVMAPFGRRKLQGFVIGTASRAPAHVETVKEITRVIDKEELFDAEYLELAQWVARMYFATLGEALAAMLPGGRRESEMSTLGADEVAFQEEPVTLSREQADAVNRIAGRRSGRFYLYGRTGSGKTEVFLQVADRVLEEGRSIIYLVPEISLTGQVIDAIRSRFHESVAVLHSRLTPSQRLTEWGRIRRGEASFVIGARSAVFAPVRSLGLIILDEEHEGSYKSGSSPRYHARQIAFKRAADADARVLMGSATPSVEAWHLMHASGGSGAAEGRGGLTALYLSRRLAGGAMPTVRTVDLTLNEGPLSAPLLEEIHATYKAGRQTVLFLNRRGFSYFFHCKSCGYAMRCTRCSVSLTYHKSRNAMVCHYCGYQTRPISVCPECGSLDVGYSGFGTEGIEDEITRRFPEMRIARLDTDSVRKKGRLEEVISRFRNGEIDLLLGTQMVAKGLNFPGLRLVGIIHADVGLTLPDFRAAERTFALITQVSGRTGRYSPDGEVIIQTYRPTTAAVKLAAEFDIEGFYAGELAQREALAFPPFTRLIRLVFRGRKVEDVEAAAQDFARLAERRLEAAAILGPAECPLGVISGNHRHHVILRSYAFGATHASLRRMLGRYHAPQRVYVEIDVDPVSLL